MSHHQKYNANSTVQRMHAKYFRVLVERLSTTNSMMDSSLSLCRTL